MRPRTFLAVAVVITLMGLGLALWNSSSWNQNKHAMCIAKNTPVTTYEWRQKAWRGADYEPTLRRLHELCVTTLYVDLTQVAVLNAAGDQPGIELLRNDFTNLVEIAKQHEITIAALAGDPEWTNDHGQQLARGIMDFASRAGVQNLLFDVEPWGLPSWNSQKETALTAYLDFVKALAQRQRSSGYTGQLGFAIPFWFDGHGGAVEKRNDGMQDKFPIEHIINGLQEGNQTFLVVMAYRNTVSGTDGASDLVQDELRLARDTKTGIVAGQETAEADPPRTTYFHSDWSTFQKNMRTLSKSLKREEAFEGLAVHDAPSLLKLSEKR